MSKIIYKIDDKSLAHILGRENFSTAYSAILELVKNAYDAGAKKVIISILPKSITIVDDGCGMNMAKMHTAWANVGISDKGYESQGRVLSGSKGIGRFALARLGNSAEVISKTLGSNPVYWWTDWNDNVLEERKEGIPIGTTIKIFSLIDVWGPKECKDLIDYLSRAKRENEMDIIIKYADVEHTVRQYFDDAAVGVNAYISLDFKVDSANKKVEFQIESDEFEDKASRYYLDHPVTGYSSEKSILSLKMLNVDWDSLEKDIEKLGPFSGKLFFVKQSVPKANREKFLMKQALRSVLNDGVVLYRNAFSIDSFDGKSDWLGLGARAAASPAAISHPGLGWRVRAYQLSGYVLIDKNKNPELRDLSNRQGIEHNASFSLFREIICGILLLMEGFRQSIVHAVIPHTMETSIGIKPMAERVSKDPEAVLSFTKQERANLAQDIRLFREENARLEDALEDQRKRASNEARVLYALSTLGLSISESAHDFHNRRNNILSFPDSVKEALVSYGLWEEICNHPNSRYAGKSVPKIIESTRDSLLVVDHLSRRALTLIRKDSFELINVPLADYIESLLARWKSEYGSLDYEIDISKDIKIDLPKDIVNVIFDNLVLNSWQQNKNEARIRIRISATFDQRTEVQFVYQDDGIGFKKAQRFMDDPMSILEPFETSKPNGHGLGMYIVNRAVVSAGGCINKIDGKEGFVFEFSLKGERQ